MIKQSGFSLIEVMVAMVIFGVVSASMAPVFMNHLKFNTAMEVRSGAYAAAQQVLDDLRSQDPSSMPSSGSSAATSVPAGDRIYSVVTSYCLQASYCASANIRHLKVEVSYKGNLVYSVETVFTKLH